MTKLVDLAKPRSRIAEAVLAGAIIAGFIHTIYLCVYYGYAVQPFIYNTFDTFMDWFNSAFWSWDPTGAYDNWGTVYPPFSFVVLRIFSIHSCYAGEPIYARDCDWLGRYTIYMTYALTVATLALVYRHNDRHTWIYRTICMALGLPMLFALERGNFIMLATMLTALGYSSYLRSARLKWLCCAISINFKVYLISGIAALLLKRKWIAAEQIVLLTITIYVVSWGILGEGAINQLVDNLLYFSSAAITGTWQDIYYPSSIMSLNRFLENSNIVIKVLGSSLVETLDIVVPIAVRLAQILVVIALALVAYRPKSIPAFRIAALAISLAVTTSESGGYAHAMVICLVLLEEWRGWSRPLALFCCYAISIPDEYVVSYVAFPHSFSWWAQIDVLGQFGVGIGNIGRPLLMLVLMYCLSSLTIHSVLSDIFTTVRKKRVIDQQTKYNSL